jgi:hypothetical protein
LQLVRFVPTERDGDYAYHAALAAAWETGETVVNIEWDMQVNADLLMDLLSCPQPLCSHAYRMYLPREYWAHGRVVNATTLTIDWCERGDLFAEYSGIGFCKIAPEARSGPLVRRPWPELEQAVNASVRGLWHLHWPAIGHDHKEAR